MRRHHKSLLSAADPLRFTTVVYEHTCFKVRVNVLNCSYLNEIVAGLQGRWLSATKTDGHQDTVCPEAIMYWYTFLPVVLFSNSLQQWHKSIAKVL